jgi:hypothetical protein
MALIRERDGKRLHVKSKLMGESLVSRSFAEGYDVAPQQRLFPDVHVLKIGGQSICDLGKKALPGVVKEIAANKKTHRMFLLTGGGTRSRHIYTIGLELGMPTGIISKFGSSISEQNALLVATLLSPWGGIKIGHDEIMKLPTYFAQGCIPVMHGMPPYDYYALPSPQWPIPIHRTVRGHHDRGGSHRGEELHPCQGRGRPLQRTTQEEPKAKLHRKDQRERADTGDTSTICITSSGPAWKFSRTARSSTVSRSSTASKKETSRQGPRRKARGDDHYEMTSPVQEAAVPVIPPWRRAFSPSWGRKTGSDMTSSEKRIGS